MKTMKLFLTPIAAILFASGSLLSSCHKDLVLPKDTPACIKEKIVSIKNEPKRDPKAVVYQYEYKGEKVYFIPSYCCDMFSELYDSNCKLICHPDGGITGKGDGKCPDFFSERKHEKVIWKDPR